MGRRFKTLDDAQVVQLEKLAAVLTMEQLADYFGIAQRTLRRRFHSDPAIMAAYKRGKSKAISGVAIGLLAQANKGNVVAMMFYLKTQAGWRETERRELEIPDIPKLSDEQLERERRRVGLVG